MYMDPSIAPNSGCGICGIASSLKCSNCGKQTYCGKLHQREHWPQHRLICRNLIKPDDFIEEHQDDTLGRYLIASTDTSEGSILFKDTPLVVGPPSAAPPMCTGCLRIHITSQCKQCGVPLCHSRCKHADPECSAIRKAKRFNILDHSDCVLPLRCLLNVRQAEGRWKEFLRLEAHLDVRRNLPVWRGRNVRIVQVLKDLGLASSDEDELIQKICGILDVNSFEVRGPDGGIVRAVFPRAALMAHSCIPNVHVAVDDNHGMTVRAATQIRKGDTLFYCYTSVLQGTAGRQEHLWEGKYFRCQCRRCQDPSEFGTHLSSIWCPRCVVGIVTPGQFDKSAMNDVVARAKVVREQAFRQFPFGEQKWVPRQGTTRSIKSKSGKPRSWQCSDCKHYFADTMMQTVDKVSTDIVDAVVPIADSGSKQFVNQLEQVLSKLQQTLTPQHSAVLYAKQLLGGAYRDQIAGMLQGKASTINSKVLNRSAELCRELAAVLDKLHCGAINRNSGIALHGLHEPLLLSLASRNLKGADLVGALSEIRQVLIAALRHLRIEPPESPEGRLASTAFAQLADVQDRLQDAEQNLKKNTRRKKNKKR